MSQFCHLMVIGHVSQHYRLMHKPGLGNSPELKAAHTESVAEPTVTPLAMLCFQHTFLFNGQLNIHIVSTSHLLQNQAISLITGIFTCFYRYESVFCRLIFISL